MTTKPKEETHKLGKKCAPKQKEKKQIQRGTMY